jgi:hypothetical protein
LTTIRRKPNALQAYSRSPENHDRSAQNPPRKTRPVDAQLRALQARAKHAERKADTRRKVIFGALGREHYEKNPESEFHHIMFRLLDEYVVRPSDRALFPELVEADLQRHATDTGSIRAAD